MIQDDISASKEGIVGHLMMDEMKLKNVISFNCKNNEIIGFIPEEMNTNNMLENILNTTKNTNNGELLYVYTN